jgi:O-antigen ligase
MQNILLYISFPTLILVSATSARTGAISPPNFARLVDVTFLIGALFYLMSLLTSGIGGSAVAGPRSYALFGMLGVAWGAARYRHGFREGMLVGTVSLTMVFLSLSRLAALSAVLIAVLALVDFRRFARSLAVTALIAAVAFFAVTHTSFSSRFSKGDVRSVAGFEINVSGRAQLWSLTWNSYESSPLIGHGVGSAETLVKQKYPGDDHPHNDYLRLLHDLGAIGLFMFLVGYLSLFARLFRARSAARTSPTIAYLLRASALSLGAVLLAMITDNPLVYLFVIAPVASVVGYSLGALLALQDEEAVFQRPVRL